MSLKINTSKECKNLEINTIEPVHKRQLTKITEEMRTDILNNMRQIDFIKKYGLSKSTYLNYKKLIYPDYEQNFNIKIDRKEFHEFIKTHNKYEVMLRYNVSEGTYYNSLKYDKEHFDELEQNKINNYKNGK